MAETTQKNSSMRLLQQTARGTGLQALRGALNPFPSLDTAPDEEAFHWEDHIPASRAETVRIENSLSVPGEPVGSSPGPSPSAPDFLAQAMDDHADMDPRNLESTVSNTESPDPHGSTQPGRKPEKGLDPGMDHPDHVYTDEKEKPEEGGLEESLAHEPRMGGSHPLVYVDATEKNEGSLATGKTPGDVFEFSAQDFKSPDHKKRGQALAPVFQHDVHINGSGKTATGPPAAYSGRTDGPGEEHETGGIEYLKSRPEENSLNQAGETANGKAAMVKEPGRPDSSRPGRLNDIAVSRIKKIPPPSSGPAFLEKEQAPDTAGASSPLKKAGLTTRAGNRVKKNPPARSGKKRTLNSTTAPGGLKQESQNGKVKINNININVRQREQTEKHHPNVPQYTDHKITEGWDWSCRYGK